MKQPRPRRRVRRRLEQAVLGGILGATAWALERRITAAHGRPRVPRASPGRTTSVSGSMGPKRHSPR